MCGTRLEQRPRNGAIRPVCPACDHTIYFDPKVAVAVCLMQDDQILLVRRGMEPMQGLWAMPAGFMEYDEDPQAAARREVLEETGLEVRIDRLLEVFHTPSDGGLANIVITYAASITGGRLQASDDADDVGWFSKANVPAVAFLPSQTIVQRWLAGEL
jgi:ADP-ribose pyrophosphatase YjhB (NUDIX family)